MKYCPILLATAALAFASIAVGQRRYRGLASAIREQRGAPVRALA